MKISSGCEAMDKLLDGGYEKDSITTIYGPPGSGKTNFCLLCIVNSVRDKKIIYIDTEGSFSVARLKQLAEDYEDVLKRLVFLNPTTYDEQKKAFLKLRDLVDDKIGLIVWDSAAALYRLELHSEKNIHIVNKEMGIQLAYLTEIARKKHIPILITNQIYSDFNDKNKINIVGGDILKWQSRCLIELQKLNNKRAAIVRKHRSIEENKSIFFRIIDNGIEEVEK